MAIEIPQNTSSLINIKAFYQQHEYPLTFPSDPITNYCAKLRNRTRFVTREIAVLLFFFFLLLNWPSHRSVMHTRKWSLNRVARPRCVHISLLLLGIHSFINVRRIVYVVFSFLQYVSFSMDDKLIVCITSLCISEI